MINKDSLLVSYAYSNNYTENYIWIYKPIYNLLKYDNGITRFNNKIISIYSTINFIPIDEIKNSLNQLNNEQYKGKADLIPNELIKEIVKSCIYAFHYKNNINYKKELIDGEYKILLLDEKTRNVASNHKFTKHLQAFIEIKETIIPNNLILSIGHISKLVYINYYYENIFCIGGGNIDNKEIFSLYHLDSFESLYNYKDSSIHLIICGDKQYKYESKYTNIKENIKNINCNILVLFLDYFEAKGFSDYLNKNGNNHDFIYGAINEEIEKKISKFENEQSILISTYNCLKGIYFNFSNYAINELRVVVAFAD